MTSPKQLHSRIILLLVIFMAMAMPRLQAQCTNQCPVITNVNINSCEGVITISVTGDGPFTYNWVDSGGGTVGNSFIASGLAPDDYTVTVTDNDGDVVTATYTVTNTSGVGMSDGSILELCAGSITNQYKFCYDVPQSLQIINGIDVGCN